MRKLIHANQYIFACLDVQYIIKHYALAEANTRCVKYVAESSGAYRIINIIQDNVISLPL